MPRNEGSQVSYGVPPTGPVRHLNLSSDEGVSPGSPITYRQPLRRPQPVGAVVGGLDVRRWTQTAERSLLILLSYCCVVQILIWSILSSAEPGSVRAAVCAPAVVPSMPKAECLAGSVSGSRLNWRTGSPAKREMRLFWDGYWL